MEANSYSEFRAEEHAAHHAEPARPGSRANDHLTVGNSRHLKNRHRPVRQAGNEIHYHAGSKVVIDADDGTHRLRRRQLPRLDPSGVTLSGATIRMNSGGAAGKTRAEDSAPVMPWLATSMRYRQPHRRCLDQHNRQLKLAAAAKLLLVKQYRISRWLMPVGGCPRQEHASTV